MECFDVKVIFLLLNCVLDFFKKSKYNKLFDVIYFLNRYVIMGLIKNYVLILWVNFYVIKNILNL